MFLLVDKDNARFYELYAIAGFKVGVIGAHPIHQYTLATAEIMDGIAFRVAVNQGMLARDLGIRYAQVPVFQTTDGKGHRIDGHGAGMGAFADD